MEIQNAQIIGIGFALVAGVGWFALLVAEWRSRKERRP